MALITLQEYSKRHGKSDSAARRMALRGGFSLAVKMGRDWFIDQSEPWPDRRIKTGKWIKKTEGSNMEKMIENEIMKATGVAVDGKSIFNGMVDAIGYSADPEGWVTGRDDKLVTIEYDVDTETVHDKENDIYSTRGTLHTIAITPRSSDSIFAKNGSVVGEPVYIKIEREFEF